MPGTGHLPLWFRRDLLNGILRLVQLGLKSGPVRIGERAAAWVLEFWEHHQWDQFEDSPRLRVTFRELAKKTFFPAPKEFWDAWEVAGWILSGREARQAPPPESGVKMPPGEWERRGEVLRKLLSRERVLPDNWTDMEPEARHRWLWGENG